MVFFANMLKVVIILEILVITFAGTHAISCLSCGKGAEHLYECREVIQCTERQACYIDRVMSQASGRPKYMAGFRDMSLCYIDGCSAKETKNLTDINKRSDVVICSECCFRSLCNSKGCGAPFEGNSTSMRCFSCPEIYGNKSCNSFTLCDKHTQMCQSAVVDSSYHPTDPNAVRLGCGSRSQLYANQHTPPEDQTMQCCDDDLCNWKVEFIANTLTCPQDLEGTCNFDHGMCGWSNMHTDEFDWLLHSGTTPTYNTGPANDHTLGNMTGKYLYIESSAPRMFGDKAWLISPKFSPGVKCLTFWYSMYGDTAGRLTVYVTPHQSFPESKVWNMTGNQGPNWKQAHVTMDSRIDFYINFEATVGDGYLGDIAIDDIVVTGHPCAAVNIVG